MVASASVGELGPSVTRTIWRLRRPTVLAIGFAYTVLSVGFWALIAAAIYRPNLRWSTYLFSAIAVIQVLVILHRAHTVRLVILDDGLWARNLFHTTFVPSESLKCITTCQWGPLGRYMNGRTTVVAIRLKDGADVPIAATYEASDFDQKLHYLRSRFS